MADIPSAAGEVFQILQSFDYTVIMYDDEGNRVDEPTEARRMFAKPENMLVSIIDDGENSSIRLFIGKNTEIVDVLGLVDSLRTAATRFNLLFNIRRYGKEISPKTFATDHSVTEDAKMLGDSIIESVKSKLPLLNTHTVVKR